MTADNVIPFPERKPEEPPFTVMTIDIQSDGKIGIWLSDENQTVSQFLWIHECMAKVGEALNEARKDRVELT